MSIKLLDGNLFPQKTKEIWKQGLYVITLFGVSTARFRNSNYGTPMPFLVIGGLIMIYIYYIVLFFLFLGIYHFERLKSFSLKLIFNVGEFFCNNVIARHFVIMLGNTLFNLGNAAIFFAMSGFFVSILHYPKESVFDFTVYGIIMTIVGYIISRCRKI